jgi:hypothetical protein
MLLYRMNLNVPIAQQLPQIQEGISNSIGNVSNSLTDVRGAISSSVQDFSSKDLVSSSNEFLQTNTLIAKFVFIVLVLIVFLILMNLGIYLLSYFFQPTKSPYLIKGIKSGSEAKQISQDPQKADSITIFRSNNQTGGMEYTWSVWLKVDDDPGSDKKHVFSKGVSKPASSTEYATSGNNAPGVYLIRNKLGTGLESTKVLSTCSMAIKMDNVTGVDTEPILIPDIPFKKWIHVAIRLENQVMDIYINGTLKKRVSFPHVPKQNYGDVWICQNGGFVGKISDLRYFDRALNVFQLMNITMAGPNMKPVPDVVDTSSDYLSNKWF